jgi:hypothetical protein
MDTEWGAVWDAELEAELVNVEDEPLVASSIRQRPSRSPQAVFVSAHHFG